MIILWVRFRPNPTYSCYICLLQYPFDIPDVLDDFSLVRRAKCEERRRNEAKRLILVTFQHRALQQPYYSGADFGSFCHTLLLPTNQLQNETMESELKKEIAISPSICEVDRTWVDNLHSYATFKLSSKDKVAILFLSHSFQF